MLTSGSTFSGGEELAYDLQQLGRATVVGERTRGGAHPVERFRIRPHLQGASRSPARSARSPAGTGKAPVSRRTLTCRHEALGAAYQRALDYVLSLGDEGPRARQLPKRGRPWRQRPRFPGPGARKSGPVKLARAGHMLRMRTKRRMSSWPASSAAQTAMVAPAEASSRNFFIVVPPHGDARRRYPPVRSRCRCCRSLG